METFSKYFSLAPTATDENLGINILNIGHYKHPPYTQYPISNHPDSYMFKWEKGRVLTEHQILYIAKGEGVFEADGLPEQRVKAGSVILLYPGIWHRYKPSAQTGWEEFWIGFKGSYVRYLLERECFSNQNPIIEIGLNTAFSDTLYLLIDHLNIKSDSNIKLAGFNLLQLLSIIYTSALQQNKELSYKEKIIELAQQKMQENLVQDFDFEQFANQQNISYVLFRKTFKELTLQSPHQYLLNLRLKKAEKLLTETKLSQAEIAFACGFESEYYFSRFFKSKTKKNPSELRKARKH